MESEERQKLNQLKGLLENAVHVYEIIKDVLTEEERAEAERRLQGMRAQHERCEQLVSEIQQFRRERGESI